MQWKSTVLFIPPYVVYYSSLPQKCIKLFSLLNTIFWSFRQNLQLQKKEKKNRQKYNKTQKLLRSMVTYWFFYLQDYMKQEKAILEAITSNGFSADKHEPTCSPGCIIGYAFKNYFVCVFARYWMPVIVTINWSIQFFHRWIISFN